jgi:glycosyltransferase involved in cell wall biosynthesis
MGDRLNVLFLTHEPLTETIAGPAIRVWELAHVLATQHRVTIGVPNRDARTSSTVDVRCYADGALAGLVQVNEITIASGYLLHQNPQIRRLARYLVMDVYGPFTLENLNLFAESTLADRVALHQAGVDVLLEQLELADFFLCASERQRDYWLGALSLANRINPYSYARDPSLRSLIDVVPFGLPSEPPKPAGHGIKGVVPGIGTGDVVALWTGGIWDWFDPLTVIEAAAALVDEVPGLKLYFMGARHPNPDIPPMIMARRAEELARDRGVLNRNVFFNDHWVPYAQRVDFLCDADLAISLHHEHIETRFSFRTRFLDAFWTGLPLLATSGDVLSDVAAAEGAGVTVGDGDVAAVREALRTLATDPDRRRAMAQRSRALGQGYTWPRVAVPLLRYCAQPQAAPDLGRADVVMPRMPAGRGSRLRLLIAAYRLDGASGVLRRVARRVKRWPARLRPARR